VPATSNWLGRLSFCTSQAIGCEDHLQNDLYCVKWDVKPYDISTLSIFLSVYLWNMHKVHSLY